MAARRASHRLRDARRSASSRLLRRQSVHGERAALPRKSDACRRVAVRLVGAARSRGGARSAERPSRRASPQTVLIFDQFEEVLTLNPADQARKEEFFAEIGRVLRDRNRWAIFAMREEYVAALDPYLRSMPTRLATRYRLDLLGPNAALDAIREPAKLEGVDFTHQAATIVIDDLRRIRVSKPGGGGTEDALGPHIEPVQLQVVCRRIWNALPADTRTIDLDTRRRSAGPRRAERGATAERRRADRPLADRQRAARAHRLLRRDHSRHRRRTACQRASVARLVRTRVDDHAGPAHAGGAGCRRDGGDSRGDSWAARRASDSRGDAPRRHLVRAGARSARRADPREQRALLSRERQRRRNAGGGVGAQRPARRAAPSGRSRDRRGRSSGDAIIPIA